MRTDQNNITAKELHLLEEYGYATIMDEKTNKVIFEKMVVNV